MAETAAGFKKWDIVLVRLTTSGKTIKTPALVISPEAYNQKHDVVLLFITSDLNKESAFGDYLIEEWEVVELPKPAKIHMQFATIPKKNLSNFSRLSDLDIRNFEKVMLNFFNLE